jgi:deazaflavin-dependent oxidoreductase (nitroreductase family)
MTTLPSDLIEQLDAARTIDVETTGRKTGRRRRTTVWVVVADGVPYVRSEYGDAGQWYRNALTDPHVAVVVGGRRVEARATRVEDPETWGQVSDAFQTKYRTSSAVGVMTDAAVEPMTLVLEPAD